MVYCVCFSVVCLSGNVHGLKEKRKQSTTKLIGCICVILQAVLSCYFNMGLLSWLQKVTTTHEYANNETEQKKNEGGQSTSSLDVSPVL